MSAAAELREVWSAFYKCDLDASGSVSKSELTSYLTGALGSEPAEIDDIFSVMDTDNNGEISIKEWEAGFDHLIRFTKEEGLKLGRAPSKGAPHVFMSYNWGAMDTVRPAITALKVLLPDTTFWLDVEQMDSGCDLNKAMMAGIQGCAVVICCFSAQYLASRNCQYELKTALELGKPIISLIVDDMKCKWPPSPSDFKKSDVEVNTERLQTLSFIDMSKSKRLDGPMSALASTLHQRLGDAGIPVTLVNPASRPTLGKPAEELDEDDIGVWKKMFELYCGDNGMMALQEFSALFLGLGLTSVSPQEFGPLFKDWSEILDGEGIDFPIFLTIVCSAEFTDFVTEAAIRQNSQKSSTVDQPTDNDGTVLFLHAGKDQSVVGPISEELSKQLGLQCRTQAVENKLPNVDQVVVVLFCLSDAFCKNTSAQRFYAQMKDAGKRCIPLIVAPLDPANPSNNFASWNPTGLFDRSVLFVDFTLGDKDRIIGRVMALAEASQRHLEKAGKTVARRQMGPPPGIGAGGVDEASDEDIEYYKDKFEMVNFGGDMGVSRAGFYTFLVSIGVDNLSVDEMSVVFDQWMDGIFGEKSVERGHVFDFPMFLTMVLQEKGKSVFYEYYTASMLRKISLNKIIRKMEEC